MAVRYNDQWLTTFLRGCKFSLERAKEKIDLYYSVRTTAPDMFALTPKNPRFMEILDLGYNNIHESRYWKNKVQEYSHWLEEDMLYRTDEAKRPGKAKTSESMFGAEGVLPPELAEKARLELTEDPKKLEDGIQHLKEWITKQPHFRARTNYWNKKIEEYTDWLDADLQYSTDESKRPGKPKTAEDIFGVDCSFRQLEFD
ncbi:hypothetical protein MSG28_002138 [Choristoneura fumiferana]|uniref:Uncharacterized protein n=1 Tax=Choristoneura fumiferana TaxID=7141 RepID=A0ACC0JUG3_CHOFU|nr:hypothetical protein MSG28_002138 [Choristoneura fumiferana]